MNLEAEFHKRLKPLCGKGLQGKIMGAFRDTMLLKALTEEQSRKEKLLALEATCDNCRDYEFGDTRELMRLFNCGHMRLNPNVRNQSE